MNQSMKCCLSVCLGCVWLFSANAMADVKLARIFGDHMVLQRDQPVAIWGEADPGEKITVKFRAQEKNVTADEHGKWLVKLDPLSAGGPDKLTVTGTKTVELQDVLVGEVWVGSGQSNMALGAGWAVDHGDAPMKAMVEGGPYLLIRHLSMYTDNRWQAGGNLNLYSGIMLAFSLRLQKELNVPIGLICNAVSGSASSSWISQEALDGDAACQAALKTFTATFDAAKEEKKFAEELVQWEKNVLAAREKKLPEPKRPVGPYKPGIGRDGGVGYLYTNCVQTIMPYAIRGVVWDQGESGTALDGVDQYTMMGALISSWRKSWGIGEFPFIYVQKPSGFGCAWDPADPLTKNAEPFSPVPRVVPDNGSGEEINNKVRIMTYPKTTMVISSDLGSGTHPLNKSAYGNRAALVALGTVYGKKVEYYGPIYDAMKVEGATIRVSFTHVGQGLTFRHGDKLQGFAIAGKDKVWHWADAKIDGETVIVSSADVPEPVAVWYAWAAFRPWANLFNKDGLPAVPFRTN